MANTTSGGYETLMSKMVQKFLYKRPVFSKLASFAENNTLTKGVSVNRPYRNNLVGFTSDYTANTDVTATDWSLTQSTLSISESKAVSIQVDPVEDKQLITTPGNAQALWASNITDALSEDMDRDFLDEVTNAGLDIDNGDFGGTASTPISLSDQNAEKVWGQAQAELQANAIGSGGLYTVIDPYMANEIAQRGIATTFTQSDRMFNNGFAGGGLLGIDTYISNNLPSTVTYTLATAIPAAADTVTINGVTFTWQTTLGSTAGNVLSETSVTQSAANLVVAINAGTGAGSKYVELSAANRAKLKFAGVSATSAAGVVTITAYGRMSLAKSHATAANAVFSAQTVYSMVAQYGCIDMVAQMQPNIQINKATNNLGSTILGHALWGTKTFEDGAQRLLKLSIQGSAAITA